MDYETNSMQRYENYLTFANLSTEKKICPPIGEHTLTNYDNKENLLQRYENYLIFPNFGAKFSF